MRYVPENGTVHVCGSDTYAKLVAYGANVGLFVGVRVVGRVGDRDVGRLVGERVDGRFVGERDVGTRVGTRVGLDVVFASTASACVCAHATATKAATTTMAAATSNVVVVVATTRIVVAVCSLPLVDVAERGPR